MKAIRLKSTRSFCVPILALSLFQFSTAQAQTDSSGASTGQLQEIIVTAQKREQRLDDVGMTISVVSADEIRSEGITDVNGLAKVTSGFVVGQSYAGYPIYSIRGVNFNSAQFSAQPAVSVYLDEAPLPYSSSTGGVLLDAERVEVLKGPQGTLFGENATGGSINVIANKPTSTFAAGANVDVNNFGQTILDGFVSGPLANTLNGRFAFTTTQFGAWQKGYYLTDGTNGSQDKGTGRILLDWTPSDALKISLNMNDYFNHGHPQQVQILSIDVQNPAAPWVNPLIFHYPLPTNARQADWPFKPTADDYNAQAVLRADYDISDALRLTSITEYLNTRQDHYFDVTGLSYPNLTYAGFGEDHNFYQELRLSGTLDAARLHYIVGGNYENDHVVDATPIQNYDNYSELPPGTTFNYRNLTKNRTYGVFGNLDFQILDPLTLTGGVRYTEVKQDFSNCQGGSATTKAILSLVGSELRTGTPDDPATIAAYNAATCLAIDDLGPAPTYLPTAVYHTQNESNVSFRAGLNYKPTPGVLLYELVSRGYKAGLFAGVATIFASQASPVKQEELTSYEVGAKLDAIPRRLHFDVSVFHYDYDNKQFETYTRYPIVGPGIQIINVPKATETGVDFDVAANPIDDLTVRGSVTYIDTKVGNYVGINLQGAPVSYDGKEFNYAPPWSAFLDTRYTFYKNDRISTFIGPSLLYNDRTYSELGQDPLTRLPAHVVIDSIIGFETTNRWRGSFYVRNLTDKYYWYSVESAGDLNSKLAGMPRTYGITLGYSF